jgi:hypothetical protein
MGEIVDRVPKLEDELKKVQVETDEEVIARYRARAEMGCPIPITPSPALVTLIASDWRKWRS